MSEHGTNPLEFPPLFPFSDDVSRDAEPRLAELRAEDPVARVRLASGHEVRVATRYADVKTVVTDSRFSVARSTDPGAPTLLPAVQPDMLLSMDPPAHTRVRQLVNKAFVISEVEALRPRVVEIVAELLDGMAEHGPPADLVGQWAKPLARRVVCHALGVQPEEQGLLEPFFDFMAENSSAPAEEVPAATQTALGYLAELIDRTRSHPADDVLSVMVQAHDGSDRLTAPELFLTTALLLGAGDNTRNNLASAVVALFRHPDQLDLLIRRPELVPAAVEELLRFTRSTEAMQSRVATADIELGGVVIRAGESVFPVAHSANRDAAVFDRPDELDITRPDAAPHLAFGHGVHFCTGAALARIEMQEGLRLLLRRFPTLQPAVPLDELGWQRKATIRTLTALPVTW
jgi:cytochrome P450